MGSKAVKFKDNSGNAVYPCPYYPVGSIYMSVNNINPATFFGGTWERLKGRFLLGADDSTYKCGDIGGTESHSHTLNNGHAFLELSSDRINMNKKTTSSYTVNKTMTGSGWYTQNVSWGSRTEVISLGGSTDSSNNIPPYLSVYMWKRTA